MTEHSPTTLYRFDGLTASGEGKEHVGRWHVPRDLPYFDGHFPGMAILPAAIVLEVSQAFLRQCRRDPAWTVTRAHHCKFKAPILPDTVVGIAAASDDGRVWRVTWSKQDEPGPIVHLELTGRS